MSAHLASHSIREIGLGPSEEMGLMTWRGSIRDRELGLWPGGLQAGLGHWLGRRETSEEGERCPRQLDQNLDPLSSLLKRAA